MRIAIGSLLALVLGGCGISADDPTNIPRAGRWQKSLRMVALTINDVSVDRADAPFPLPADTTSMVCGEPFMRNRADAQREIDKIGGGIRCALDETQADGPIVTGGGRCTLPSGRADKVTATLAFTAEQTPDTMDLRQDFDAYVHLPDGQTEQLRLVHKVAYRRLEDCR